MQLQDYTQALAIVVIVAIIIVCWPPKNRAFRRRGIDPGFLDLKVWPARIWFLLKGREIVDEAYLQVRAGS